MPYTDEIKQAAEGLGQQLGADPDVREYFRLKERAEQDANLAALEARYSQLHASLVKREAAGDLLERATLDEYYQVRAQLLSSPLIVARDEQLAEVKALFAHTALRLSEGLGVDYLTLAS